MWLPTPIAASARYLGTYALSGVAVLAAGAVLLAVTRQWRTSTAMLALPILLGMAALEQPAPTRMTATAPRVRVVQPDLDQEQRPRDDYAEANLRQLARLSGKPGPAPRLIVWPEGALRFLPEDGYPRQYYWEATPYETRHRIAALLGPKDVVLTGGNALMFDSAGTLSSATNAIFALDAHARILGRYDKGHLVPFG
jgi:apolipoprotein N-acyltransferase